MAVDLLPLIERAERDLSRTEGALASFNFADSTRDRRDYETLRKEHQRLSRLLDVWRQRQDVHRRIRDNEEMLGAAGDDAELAAVIREDLTRLTEQAAVLESAVLRHLLPPDPDDARGLIVEIRPAAGGDEASLFAADLLRMYTRFAERKGWRCEVLKAGASEVGGVKDAAFAIEGSDAYRCMHYESGVHRVQRVPVTEAAGRIHTSTVTVAVLREAEDVEVQISPEDLRIDVFRSSGPGGQHVNRTDSAVRITYLPTGLVVASQQERSQHRNREIAMRLLRSRLLEQRREEEETRHAATRREQVGSGERNERIRTYNFPQNRVTDHRFGITLHGLPELLDGGLGRLVDQIISMDVEQRLEAQATRPEWEPRTPS
jgi:peptide chain release factor 1